MKCFASSLPLDTSASSHHGVQRVRDQRLSQALRRCVSLLKRKTVTPWVFSVGERQAVRVLANTSL